VRECSTALAGPHSGPVACCMASAWVIGIIATSVVVLVAWRVWALRRRARARAEYQRVLRSALEDGILSPEESAQLEAVRTAGSLSPEETRTAALAIYRVALRDAAADARLTPDEEASLERLRTQLGLSEG